MENETMYFIPYSYVNSIHNVSIILEGNIILHDNISAWNLLDEDKYLGAFDIRNSTNITKMGNYNGVIEGQGANWWLSFFRKIPDNDFNSI